MADAAAKQGNWVVVPREGQDPAKIYLKFQQCVSPTVVKLVTEPSPHAGAFSVDCDSGNLQYLQNFADGAGADVTFNHKLD